MCCFGEGSPHLWAIVWRIALNHFEYFRVVHVFPWAAIWLVRGRDTKFVENSFVLLSLQERKERKRFKRLGKSETKFENLLVWLLKEMRFLKKSGFVTKMDTAGFKPSFRYFLWFWSSSDVSNALKTWKMMICSQNWDISFVGTHLGPWNCIRRFISFHCGCAFLDQTHFICDSARKHEVRNRRNYSWSLTKQNNKKAIIASRRSVISWNIS